MPNTDSLLTLQQGLLHPDPVVQADAARLLGELGARDAVGPLLDYVASCRYHLKTAGIEALSHIGSHSAVPVLQELVRAPNVHDDWYWFCCKAVRAAAAVALLSLDDDAGAEYLTELADSGDDVFFAWYAPALLRAAKAHEKAKPLAARITTTSLFAGTEKGTRLTNPGTLIFVTEALGEIGNEEACNRLLELLTWRSRYVRGQAALSLLQSTSENTYKQIVEQRLSMEETDFARIKTAQALVQAGMRQHAHVLVTAVESAPDAFDQAAAIEALGLLGQSGQQRVVEPGLAHADPYVRRCAVEALDRLGASPDRIAGLVRDPDPRVRLQAAKFVQSRVQEQEEGA